MVTTPTNTDTTTARDDEAILAEMRERFTYGTDEWRPIRDEASKDMRYIAGDCWDPDDRHEREEAGRICLNVDELSQYVNQAVNGVRQNKRGIKVTPEGEGANDETAAFRQGLMRQIEYRSNAVSGAYVTMFENAVQRGYGFLRITAKYVSNRSFNQELVIDPLPNPDLVTVDPDGVRTDGKDWRWGFIHESRSTAQFKRDFPNAAIKDFTTEHQRLAPQWFNGKRVQIAEYWTIETRRRELLMLRAGRSAENPTGAPLHKFADELQAPPSADAVMDRRWVDDESVRQYFSNGFELLAAPDATEKFTAWKGSSIPIVPCYGRVLYLEEGGSIVRKLLSLIRLARDPQMLYAYYRTCQAELVAITPKTPFVGYTGQFRGQEDTWALVNSTPQPYLEANPFVEGVVVGGSQTPLPLPQRQPYDPPIQQLEVGAEAARRAIQAAIGQSPLPTSAQRRNEKSGVALQQMDHSAQVGNFHFVDHYDEGLTRTGAILDELIPFYYDTTGREVAIRKPDDSLALMRINDPTQQGSVRADVGRHDVTISTAPHFDSDREAAADFADTLANSPAFPQIADLVIKLRNLGPIGDEIAERLTPPQFRKPAQGQQPLPPEVQQAMAAAQQQIQQLTALAHELQQKLQVDQVKIDGAIRMKAMDLEFQQWKAQRDSETKIAVAELGAKVDRLALFLEERARLGIQATTALEGARDRTHDVVMAHVDQAHALQKGAQDTAAAAALADQSHGNALELQANAPAPEGEASA